MNRLRLITTPYSLRGRLFEAYEETFQLVGDDDWVCFLDGDVAFLEMADFGHRLQEYIDKYPEAGLFTCYASRCSYRCQSGIDTDRDSDSIKYFAQKSIDHEKYHLRVKKVERRIAGHLVMMKKSTWMEIRMDLGNESKTKKILGFDTKLSNTLIKHKKSILVMEGIMIFHYFRLLTGKNNKIK